MVNWSKPAEVDLRQIYEYIKKDSKFYAKKVCQEIVDKSEILNTFPEVGRVVPELGEPKIRELLIYSYRLIYEIFPDKIEVLALIHSKRNFIREFLDEQQKDKT